MCALGVYKYSRRQAAEGSFHDFKPGAGHAVPDLSAIGADRTAASTYQYDRRHHHGDHHSRDLHQ